MSSHFSIVSKFSSIFTSNEAVSEAIRKASGQSNRSFSYSDVEEDSALTHDHVVLALQMSIKMADLGHVLAEPHVHLNWVNGLEEEYFRQGDKEKVVFGPGSTSPLMDRASPGITAFSKSSWSLCTSNLRVSSLGPPPLWNWSTSTTRCGRPRKRREWSTRRR